MSPPGGKGAQDMITGAGLQCVEAATLGMPFEVWKTRMGRFRNEGTIEAFGNVYRNGGIPAFWAGVGPKMVESATKGAVLIWSKEILLSSCNSAGLDPIVSGVIAGAGGGVAQTSVMGPMTFLVTAKVTGDKNVSTTRRVTDTWNNKGIKGFYSGASAVAFRQATNWASRQGFTDAARQVFISRNHGGDKKAKLTKPEEVTSGVIGGFLACWNHPFEVARIEMQARGAFGEKKLSLSGVLGMIYKERGVAGWFKGVVPRIGLGIWQTLFMVTGARIVKEAIADYQSGSA
eukprot:TRINITY_DN6616_c2_g1_i1.p1 TRINITY_DN6616_c2_g1~~TRINITY_DN6616_c2_g1_i1.p1  ORF type:complete len:289 (+),score=48.43 TRINITY_DN6616_c2_g1_i1:79-945(+)